MCQNVGEKTFSREGRSGRVSLAASLVSFWGPPFRGYPECARDSDAHPRRESEPARHQSYITPDTAIWTLIFRKTFEGCCSAADPDRLQLFIAERSGRCLPREAGRGRSQGKTRNYDPSRRDETTSPPILAAEIIERSLELRSCSEDPISREALTLAVRVHHLPERRRLLELEHRLLTLGVLHLSTQAREGKEFQTKLHTPLKTPFCKITVSTHH